MGINLTLRHHLGSSESEKLRDGGASPFSFHEQRSQEDRHQDFISCLHTIATHSFPLSTSTQILPNPFCDFPIQNRYLKQSERAPQSYPAAIKASCVHYPHKQNVFQKASTRVPSGCLKVWISLFNNFQQASYIPAIYVIFTLNCPCFPILQEYSSKISLYEKGRYFNMATKFYFPLFAQNRNVLTNYM